MVEGSWGICDRAKGLEFIYRLGIIPQTLVKIAWGYV